MNNCNNCGHNPHPNFEQKEPCNKCFQYDHWTPKTPIDSGKGENL